MPDYKARKLHVLKSLLFLALFISIHSHCYAWFGKVVGVSDGDIIGVLHNGYPERIRLYGIDCPEKRQAFGKKKPNSSPPVWSSRKLWISNDVSPMLSKLLFEMGGLDGVELGRSVSLG